MFRLSKITDYGIVILAHLARDETHVRLPAETSPALHSARQVASDVDLPLPVVSKIMKSLARHGVLDSHRGAKGGFSLGRDPADINVEEMIAALEGPVALTECNGPVQGCQIEGHCPVRDPWQVINRVVQVALSKITLADLIDPAFTSNGTTLQILSRDPTASPLTEMLADAGAERLSAGPSEAAEPTALASPDAPQREH